MSVSKTIKQKHEEMFYPTVRVRSKQAGGSGTVVYSSKHKGSVHTYIITNHHVVEKCIDVERNGTPH